MLYFRVSGAIPDLHIISWYLIIRDMGIIFSEKVFCLACFYSINEIIDCLIHST